MVVTTSLIRRIVGTMNLYKFPVTKKVIQTVGFNNDEKNIDKELAELVWLGCIKKGRMKSSGDSVVYSLSKNTRAAIKGNIVK